MWRVKTTNPDGTLAPPLKALLFETEDVAQRIFDVCKASLVMQYRVQYTVESRTAYFFFEGAHILTLTMEEVQPPTTERKE
jgi:hypothetical protein